MEYDGDRYRTLSINEITEHICLKNKELEEKNGTKIFEKIFAPRGSVAVLNSNHYLDELIEIGGFAKIIS